MMTAFVQADHLARAWVVTHRFVGLNEFMWLLSVRGGLVFLFSAAAIALKRRQPGDFLTVAAGVLLASVITNQVLKPLFHRERPFVSTPAVLVIGGEPDDPSFPSGHSASAFAGAVGLSAIMPSAWTLWWSLAAATAYSRVYLGVHYPSDVVGGALIGLFSGIIARKLVPRRTAIKNGHSEDRSGHDELRQT